MGESVSKSSNRLYRDSYIDYCDTSGQWRQGQVCKVDDTWNKESIVIVCSESREMQHFVMRTKVCKSQVNLG